jgi:hypothetical protein
MSRYGQQYVHGPMRLRSMHRMCSFALCFVQGRYAVEALISALYDGHAAAARALIEAGTDPACLPKVSPRCCMPGCLLALLPVQDIGPACLC